MNGILTAAQDPRPSAVVDRYWTFELLETGIYLTVAILLAWACFWWVRRLS